AVVGVAQVEDRRREQLGLTPTEDLYERAVDTEQATVDRRERHADRRVLERAPEPLLRLAQLSFRETPVGEVARADDDALDRGVVEQVGGDRLDHAPSTVGVTQAPLHPPGIV